MKNYNVCVNLFPKFKAKKKSQNNDEKSDDFYCVLSFTHLEKSIKMIKRGNVYHENEF